MDLNFFNVLIFSGVIQGISFGYTLLTSSIYKNAANRFLALTILSLSLGNLNFWFLDTGLLQKHLLIDFFQIKWHLIFPVFFYSYILKSLHLKSSKLFLLLVPAILSIGIRFTIKVYQYIYSEQLINITLFYVLEEYIALFLALFLGVKAFKQFKNLKISGHSINITWYESLFSVALTLYILWFTAYTLILFLGAKATYLFYPLLLLISFLFFWIAYKGTHLLAFSQPSEYSNKKVTPTTKNTQKTKSKTVSKNNPTYTKLKVLITEDKIYKDPTASLDSIAAKLNVSPSYLSQVINKVTGKNFSNYINTYRIEEVKKMLLDPEFENYSILAMGHEVGFNSKSVFYTTFKKQTGLTPKQFKLQNTIIHEHKI
ncbi:helix-turn-helix transcriptional regulator [Tenacibaculum sp. 190524A02b]|uniref:helix-turn-helix domain-containing protein n=1 Tax=Tenacibaculum vairaonense TaxID=3137860 RepID=UPI0031FAF4DE